MKKCSSCCGVPAAEPKVDIAGMGGTGGIRSGVDSTDLLVTPGIYAICMTFDALVSTVEAIERTECIDARPLWD